MFENQYGMHPDMCRNFHRAANRNARLRPSLVHMSASNRGQRQSSTSLTLVDCMIIPQNQFSFAVFSARVFHFLVACWKLDMATSLHSTT